jgi:hypothetical protein
MMRPCSDLDDDCPGVINKVKCWLYDPGRGMCPWLRPNLNLEDRRLQGAQERGTIATAQPEMCNGLERDKDN